MTQQEFNRLVALDIQRLVAKAQAEYEAKLVDDILTLVSKAQLGYSASNAGEAE